MNLVKLHALRQDMIIEPLNSILITDISNNPVGTIGTVKITVFKSPVEIRVVGNELPISPDGILGRPYLQQEQARISIEHNTFVTISNPIPPIPFVDAELQEANSVIKSEIKPFARILKMKARTRQPIAVDVSNSGTHQGYLPRIDTPEGLYIGEASVTAQDSKCHVLAIKTTEQDIEFNVPPQEIIPFYLCRLPGEESSESEIEDLPEYP